MCNVCLDAGVVCMCVCVQVRARAHVCVCVCVCMMDRWISSFLRDRTVKVRILGHTSREIAIIHGVPQGSPVSPLLFLLYMSKLPKLLPNTRRSLFADDFMIYSESSVTRSDLIQSNLQTLYGCPDLFSSDHRIILSCTKSVRVLFERKMSHRLKPQDVPYNGQAIPSSSSVKFLGITFDSAPTFRSYFCTVATLAHHRLLKLNSIFSSTYGPSTLIRLYKSYICSLFDYGVPTTCVASPTYNLVGRGYKLISFCKHFPFHPSSTTTENGSTCTFHPSTAETCS